MANHFKQMQVELERMGYEYQSRNSKGGETWTHGCGDSVVIYPGMKEYTHRLVLRDRMKAVGISQQTNKRKVDQIKDRQSKQREIDHREMEARSAWLAARIRDLEMAASMRVLTAKQQQLLTERLAEWRDLQRLMTQVPSHRA